MDGPLHTGNKSAFNYEQKQSTPTHGPPLQSMNNQTPSLNNQWKSGTSYSSTTPMDNQTPTHGPPLQSGGGATTPFRTNILSNKFKFNRKPSTFFDRSPKSVRPLSNIQHTMTATYAGWFNIPKRDLLDSEQKQPFKKKKKSTRIIPLSSKRGTILLSEPLKRSRITDARDRGLAKLRNDNQILQQRLEELQFENRRLQIERDQNTNEINEFEYKTKQMEKYINSLNNMLFSKMANEKIYWYSNEPIFEIKNVNYNNKHNPNHDIGMNMNLDIIEYDKNYCNIMDEKINDENNQKNQFENYLEKIIRCARIFQAQYYNTLVQKQEKEKQLITLEKQNTISIDTLNTSKTIEIETLKVQLGNVEKNFENERKIIDKKHEHSLELREKKINEFKLQLQKKNKDIEYEKKKCGEVQIKMQNIINEKRVLGIEYGKIKDTLNEREQHPILSNIKRVDNILLNYKNIQREFYIEIFDETANIHNMAFEYIRKEIKSKTSYMNRYCKQMTLKILFEIIHICWNKINKSFNEIYNKIRIHLGIYNNNKKKNNKLEEGLDFLLKYQFEEILGNLFQILIHNIIEEIYEIEFDLIKSNSGQNILTYNLHETINPMIRNKCVIDYISKICIICWKMVIFSHKNEMQNKLMFYPMHFMETQNEIRVNGEVYDKCTAHCEKKCDQILFYVFPIIIKKEYENNIFKTTLQIATNIISNLLSNILIKREYKNSNIHKEALLELAKVMSNNNSSNRNNIENLIENVRKTVYKSVKCDKVALFMVDEIRHELWCNASDDVAGIRLPLNKGIVGHTVTTGEILNITDAYKDLRFNPSVDKKTNYRTKTILCVPIKYNNRIIGALECINKTNGEYFSEADVILLNKMAQETAPSLQNKFMESALRIISQGLQDSSSRDYLSQFMHNEDNIYKKDNNHRRVLSLQNYNSSPKMYLEIRT
eukprot:510444_1